MADISKCTNDICLLAHNCYRYQVPSKNIWQSYTAFHPKLDEHAEPECEHFIPFKDTGC